jgi:type IV pilus assembly protein PilA
MNKAFTLIELMIVIAIIAIIAAIAIPNLLESRITANEANAATSLKSGVFPGQVQFQAGGYIDSNGNGRGIYCSHPRYMAGATGPGDSLTSGPKRALSLLDPKFNNQLGVSSSSNAGAYDYSCYINTGNETDAEMYWGGSSVPITTDGNNGRRMFGVNATGSIYQTKGSVDLASLTVGSASTLLFAVSPATSVATAATTASPYQK